MPVLDFCFKKTVDKKSFAKKPLLSKGAKVTDGFVAIQFFSKKVCIFSFFMVDVLTVK
ncbi:MAG: hypothetical protein IJV77_06875 [Clostridia bacterium]|nr:hypothetical protein [Clostridia bacterium]